jgi:hypothetical protein
MMSKFIVRYFTADKPSQTIEADEMVVDIFNPFVHFKTGDKVTAVTMLQPGIVVVKEP